MPGEGVEVVVGTSAAAAGIGSSRTRGEAGAVDEGEGRALIGGEELRAAGAEGVVTGDDREGLLPPFAAAARRSAAASAASLAESSGFRSSFSCVSSSST